MKRSLVVAGRFGNWDSPIDKFIALEEVAQVSTFESVLLGLDVEMFKLCYAPSYIIWRGILFRVMMISD